MQPIESDNTQISPTHYGDRAGTVSSDNTDISDIRPTAPPQPTPPPQPPTGGRAA